MADVCERCQQLRKKPRFQHTSLTFVISNSARVEQGKSDVVEPLHQIGRSRKMTGNRRATAKSSLRQLQNSDIVGNSGCRCRSW